MGNQANEAALSAAIPAGRNDRASIIARHLEQNILSGHYEPGDRLPSEVELCAHFAVSRPTLREALGRLSAQGLLRTRRGSGGGAFVTQPNTGELGARFATMIALATAGDDQAAVLLEARMQLGMACARRAAQIRADIADMRAEIDLQSDFERPNSEFLASCQRLHLALAAASGNAVMQLLTEAVVEAAFSSPPEEYPTRVRARYLSFHVRLANGIAGGRPEDAESAMSDLWNYDYERLTEHEAGPEPEAEAPAPERPPRMRDLRIPPVQRLGGDTKGGN